MPRNGDVAIVDSPTFGELAALPRGPHGHTRDHVSSLQRRRLLAAITTLVAERGYPDTTITETVRWASVSPNVFYEHFATKQECLLAAYDVFAQTLLTQLMTQVSSTGDWHSFLTTAANTYLSALDADRDAARAFLIEMDAAGPEARRRRHDAIAAFAGLIRERHAQIRAQDPNLGALPDRIYLGFGLGVRALVCDHLEHSSSSLTELAPDIVRWMNATIQGAAASEPTRSDRTAS
ncbi:MAG: TetR/AcrR family transcriptional regulator [Solirubrobacteraceae bacterium]